jgi:hypothetical protein
MNQILNFLACCKNIYKKKKFFTVFHMSIWVTG